MKKSVIGERENSCCICLSVSCSPEERRKRTGLSFLVSFFLHGENRQNEEKRTSEEKKLITTFALDKQQGRCLCRKKQWNLLLRHRLLRQQWNPRGGVDANHVIIVIGINKRPDWSFPLRRFVGPGWGCCRIDQWKGWSVFTVVSRQQNFQRLRVISASESNHSSQRLRMFGIRLWREEYQWNDLSHWQCHQTVHCNFNS